jgi:hypothetical protein
MGKNGKQICRFRLTRSFADLAETSGSIRQKDPVGTKDTLLPYKKIIMKLKSICTLILFLEDTK